MGRLRVAVIPDLPKADSDSTPTNEIVLDVSQDRLLTLAEHLAAEMASSWRHGRQTRADHFFRRHPQLLESRDAAFRLICEEICLAQEAGLTLNADSLAARFPHWKTEIQRLLECHELLK